MNFRPVFPYNDYTSMRTIKILTLILLLASFGLRAQSREEFGGKSQATDISKLVSIYPNPAAGTVQLYWNTATAGLTRIKVVDIVGRTLIQKNLKETKGTNLHQLSLDKLKNGNYILIMNVKGNCRTAMFRVQN